MGEASFTTEQLTDADFAQRALEGQDRSEVTVVLFYRADCEKSAQALQVLEQIAQTGYRAFRLDISAEHSRETAARFAIAHSLLILFRGGTFRTIVDGPIRSSWQVEHWLEREAAGIAA